MASYKLSNKAELELANVYEYSIINFGLSTAREYLNGLHDRFQSLADHPSWGTNYDFVMPGLRRYEFKSHAIYYVQTDEGALIVRILGGRQDPKRYF